MQLFWRGQAVDTARVLEQFWRLGSGWDDSERKWVFNAVFHPNTNSIRERQPHNLILMDLNELELYIPPPVEFAEKITVSESNSEKY